MPFWLDYSGHTVDEFDTEAEAEADFTITPYQED